MSVEILRHVCGELSQRQLLEAVERPARQCLTAFAHELWSLLSGRSHHHGSEPEPDLVLSTLSAAREIRAIVTTFPEALSRETVRAVFALNVQLRVYAVRHDLSNLYFLKPTVETPRALLRLESLPLEGWSDKERWRWARVARHELRYLSRADRATWCRRCFVRVRQRPKGYFPVELRRLPERLIELREAIEWFEGSLSRNALVTRRSRWREERTRRGVLLGNGRFQQVSDRRCGSGSHAE